MSRRYSKKKYIKLWWKMIYDAVWILALVLVGFGIGLLVSIFGGGGGFFYVPILTLLFGVPTQFAVSTSLASIIPTTLVGSISHYRMRNVNIRIGITFGIGGIIGALIGAYISSLLSPSLLGRLFGLFMIILSIPMLLSVKQRVKNVDTERATPPLTKKRIMTGAVFGILSGSMAGLFGLSGTPPVMAGLYIMGLPAATVVGTSLFVLFFNAVFGLAGHLVLGQIDLVLTLFLALGATAGAFLGPRFLGKAKNSTLEKIYGPLFTVMVFAIGLIMIFG
ncbi:MAG: uncharacterized protein PWQ88_906 [Candidatus Methanomethylophilaceae archaeon]|nr:uncharacterized protein [Candidatus Methanomethylophilaceae archaeon]